MSNIQKHMATPLVPGRASAAHERRRVVADIKAQTANALRAFGRERKVMAKTLRSDLAADQMSRSGEVHQILENANEKGSEFRQDHELMRNNLRHSLVESREAVVSAVSSLFIDFSKERADFSKAHQDMAQTLKSGLAADRMGLSAEVLEIRHHADEVSKGLRQDRALMRHELRRSLAQSRQAVGTSVASLCNEFSKERVDFAKSLRRMAKAQGAGLARDRRERSHAVAALMRSFARTHHHMAKAQWAGLAKCRRDRAHSLAELMQGFHVSRGHLGHPLARSLPATTPMARAPLPSSHRTAPVALKPGLRIEPAAPVASTRSVPVKASVRVTEKLAKAAPLVTARRESAKPLSKVAHSAAKPWPSTPPRGEPVKPVAKKAQAGAKAKVKAAPAKAVHPKAKTLKPKKK